MEILKAFCVGGAICVVGQLLIDYTKLTPARILVGYVVAGVVLGGLGLYQPFVEWAGAGASVPLLGFGNTIAKGTLQAIQEKGILGILSGGLTGSSTGIGAALFFSLIAGMIFKSQDRNQ